MLLIFLKLTSPTIVNILIHSEISYLHFSSIAFCGGYTVLKGKLLH